MPEKERDLKKKCQSILKNLNLKTDFWIYWTMDTTTSGIPDAIFCARGLFGWVELKSKSGHVSAIQSFMHNKIQCAGGRGMVCRTAEEFRQFISSFYH